ncbi:MAG: DUF4278 domain-containing protein [Cyanobacteria bacterium CRU_2_1]|nr:DUF4278 domain-containing protein [Cyanobacteria bacterium RU_5_0]NJR57620.1 DUF4278 domain-containing protein [Cyanobacteria bacterium CRU_2_1]
MKLSYRGIEYKANSSFVAENVGEVVGKYRGTHVKLGISNSTEASRSVKLLYRGTSYTKLS